MFPYPSHHGQTHLVSSSFIASCDYLLPCNRVPKNFKLHIEAENCGGNSYYTSIYTVASVGKRINSSAQEVEPGWTTSKGD